MKSVQAWLLDLGPFRIAVAYSDVVEVISEPTCWSLPIGPRWCRELMAWRGRYIPLARLGVMADSPFAIVIAVAAGDDEDTEFVSLRLLNPPRLIDVYEQDDCDPPMQLPLPSDHILACFNREDEVVVIPDLARLFKVTEAVEQV